MSIIGHLSEPVKNTADALSIGSAAAVLFGWLPQITALLGALWLILRIVIGWQEYRLNQRKLK